MLGSPRFLLPTFLLLFGCASDSQEPLVCNVTLPEECPEPPVRYGDVAGIFANRCTVCHDPDDLTGPWPLDNYNHVAGWYDLVRDEIASCSMPPRGSGVTLSAAERDAVLTWVACGVPE